MTSDPYRPARAFIKSKTSHFWDMNKNQCVCGSNKRVWVGRWFCLKKLEELLGEQNIRIINSDDS